MLCLKAGYSQNWVKEIDKNEVQVYSRYVPGKSAKEFKGEVIISTNLGSLVAVMDDIPSYTKWMYNCRHSERLAKLNDFEGYSYYINTSPWPMTDRDIIIHYKLSQHPSLHTITIDLKGEKAYRPETDLVRVPELNGFWKFTPLDDGRIWVVYQVYSETGGSVPEDISNAFLADLPYHSLLNLKRMIENPAFKKTYNSKIAEPKHVKP